MKYGNSIESVEKEMSGLFSEKLKFMTFSCKLSLIYSFIYLRKLCHLDKQTSLISRNCAEKYFNLNNTVV